MKTSIPHLRTINGGSASIKQALFEARDARRQILARGIERIGLPDVLRKMINSAPRSCWMGSMMDNGLGKKNDLEG